ncbi:hypothetical protein V9K67_06650 [Paraflavisolibacter sp. H34]|uniref:hypothetical protein n=1 Tax=Huijunlia imazamoxiresistens TaxID=3127457 RepID=UPI0030173A28
MKKFPVREKIRRLVFIFAELPEAVQPLILRTLHITAAAASTGSDLFLYFPYDYAEFCHMTGPGPASMGAQRPAKQPDLIKNFV